MNILDFILFCKKFFFSSKHFEEMKVWRKMCWHNTHHYFFHSLGILNFSKVFLGKGYFRGFWFSSSSLSLFIWLKVCKWGDECVCVLAHVRTFTYTFFYAIISTTSCCSHDNTIKCYISLCKNFHLKMTFMGQ